MRKKGVNLIVKCCRPGLYSCIGIVLYLLYSGIGLRGQATFSIQGEVVAKSNGKALVGADVYILHSDLHTQTDTQGRFQFTRLAEGEYELAASFLGLQALSLSIQVDGNKKGIRMALPEISFDMEDVSIEEQVDGSFGITRLKAVEGTAIYAAKKSEVILVEALVANKATNNSRQVYAKVAGLNIWESDGAGVQLGIGGRGLSPNRNSNFNTRQNGYDISADALGYPESYYSPPVEAIDRIEVVRGAASLQYGTQFGGLLNFKFKQGPVNKPIEWTSRQTIGSFGLFSSFNSVGGKVGKVRYYGFYQYKQSKGWRPNSSLDQHTAYASLSYEASPKLTIRPEYTYTTYLAQQPGGLTDTQFELDPRQSNRERNWFQVDWNLLALTLDYKFSARTQLNTRSFGLIAGRDALGNLDPINLLDFGENRDLLKDDFRNWGNETRLIHRYTLNKQISSFLIGGRYYQGFTHRRQGEGDDGREADFTYNNTEDLEGSDFDLPSRNVSVFAENVFNLSRRFSLTPGIRFEYIKTETEGYYKNRVEDLAGNVILDERIREERSNDRSFLFAGLGISYKLSERFEVYGNFSQNYRAINFNDIRVNVGSLVVDPDLTDERGFNIDLGYRGNIPGLLDVDISLFHLSYQDRIGTLLKREPNPQFNNLVDRTIRFRTNVADAAIYGVEAFGELNVWKWIRPNDRAIRLSLFANLAIISGTYANSEENGIEGNDVELIPPVNFKSGLTFSWKELQVAYQYAFVDEHFSDASNAIQTPTAIEGLIPAYSIMDLSFTYRYKFLQLETGINNLADERYFTRRATGYPGPGIIPSDGRSFYVTLQVQI